VNCGNPFSSGKLKYTLPSSIKSTKPSELISAKYLDVICFVFVL